MTPHPLDRVVWHALATRQAGVAKGGPLARRMIADIGMFAAAADRSSAALAALAALVPAGTSIATLEEADWPLPPGLSVTSAAECLQMVAADVAPTEPGPDDRVLTEADSPAMLALATATKPGPFFRHTHRLGRFVGVVEDGALVAMAGERLTLPGFTEVSGVCTRPDRRGHGHAARLMRIVATAIVARGDVPILHSYAANASAVALYERLGFRTRRRLPFTILTRG